MPIHIIPVDKLSAEALHGIIQEFISRNGTDYGEFEASAEKPRVLYPPRCGIVQLTNSATLRFRNWSFTKIQAGKTKTGKRIGRSSL